MSHDVDDEIRADFLTEAGELVQRLGEQLIELESRPHDVALLNDIFRAFHTVKGGAGFLDLPELVELCHVAEDVFNQLRSGKREVDAELMDAMLQALDAVQSMMHAVSARQQLAPAAPALLQRLRALNAPTPPAAAAPAAPVEVTDNVESTAAAPKKTRRRSSKSKAVEAEPAPAPAPAASDTITDDEFEALLDQLHGKGSAPGVAVTAVEAPAPVPAAAPAVAAPAISPEPKPAAASSTPVAAPSAVAGPPTETTVRVDIARLDKMMNLVGELVLVRNRLKDLRERHATAADIARAVGELDFITRGLQSAVMQVRMQPIRKVFSRFPKIARDVARGLGKQVEVELQGEDTDLDKNLVEALADPLVHMVRNSVDHGIEMPEERMRRGKPAAGHLTLSAQQEGDHILITVRDDGAGIDSERVRSKAIEKGLLGAAEAAQLSHDECLQLVFLPGFSTKEEVSDLSGRGVGMDVVMSRIKSLNGSVRIESRIGFGSSVHIRVPLTLAILSALMVRAEGRKFALPLAPVQDVFELRPDQISKLDRWDVVLTRRDTLRLIYLDPWLATESTQEPRHVVVAQVGEDRYGFVVREVVGREEIVIKPLGSTLRGTPGVAAATVLPDGRVALILEFPGLVDAYRRVLIRTGMTPVSRLEAANG
ncbi:chemotaxis protein CheA [Sinimarinibacterium sp. CAU 1509]|uniref:chemotaxis protein CheA n=1 Tax=Sinimarinibacterium sp. CAU 1509 TaxID=2562283 RepID=UPI0010AD1F44|nr:chemotaxis protein CheA [Sinimarinibacterium sp. CAU 1509]TJY62835.1 chemotaxis protein CheA [Sinimarinibacterium sp. CAU 1509]